LSLLVLKHGVTEIKESELCDSVSQWLGLETLIGSPAYNISKNHSKSARVPSGQMQKTRKLISTKGKLINR